MDLGSGPQHLNTLKNQIIEHCLVKDIRGAVQANIILVHASTCVIVSSVCRWLEHIHVRVHRMRRGEGGRRKDRRNGSELTFKVHRQLKQLLCLIELGTVLGLCGLKFLLLPVHSYIIATSRLDVN